MCGGAGAVLPGKPSAAVRCPGPTRDAVPCKAPISQMWSGQMCLHFLVVTWQPHHRLCECGTADSRFLAGKKGTGDEEKAFDYFQLSRKSNLFKET